MPSHPGPCDLLKNESQPAPAAVSTKPANPEEARLEPLTEESGRGGGPRGPEAQAPPVPGIVTPREAGASGEACNAVALLGTARRASPSEGGEADMEIDVTVPVESQRQDEASLVDGLRLMLLRPRWRNGQISERGLHLLQLVQDRASAPAEQSQTPRSPSGGRGSRTGPSAP